MNYVVCRVLQNGFVVRQISRSPPHRLCSPDTEQLLANNEDTEPTE